MTNARKPLLVRLDANLDTTLDKVCSVLKNKNISSKCISKNKLINCLIANSLFSLNPVYINENIGDLKKLEEVEDILNSSVDEVKDFIINKLKEILEIDEKGNILNKDYYIMSKVENGKLLLSKDTTNGLIQYIMADGGIDKAFHSRIIKSLLNEEGYIEIKLKE